MFPLTVEVERHRVGANMEDAFGNPIPGGQTTETVAVFAWWIGGGGESGDAVYVERVNVDASLMAAPGDFIPGDQVTLDGALYDVEGKAKNWDHNPWWSPGLDLVELKAVTG